MTKKIYNNLYYSKDLRSSFSSSSYIDSSLSESHSSNSSSGYCKVSKYKNYGRFIGKFETNIHPGVSISFKLFEEGIKGHLYVSSNIGCKLSAITINKNEYKDGRYIAGPILFWLATSSKWEHGIKQLTPYTNYPCCSNKTCNLSAPKGTPYIHSLIGKTTKFYYKFKVNKCDYRCKILEDFVSNWLVIYGKDFKTYKDRGINCHRCGSIQKHIGVDSIGTNQFSKIHHYY